MMLYNGSPDPLLGRAEGNAYTLPAGEIFEVENGLHGELLLTQFEMKGLCRISAKDIADGDASDQIKERCREAFVDFWEKQFSEFNDLQVAQNKSGLPGIVPTKELRRMQSIFKQFTGRDLAIEESTVKPEDATKQLTAAFLQILQQIQGGKSEAVEAKLLELGASVPSGPGRARSQENAKQARSKAAKEK